MATGIASRLKHAWNVFFRNDFSTEPPVYPGGVSYGSRVDRPRVSFSNERTIIASIYNRLCIDVAALDVFHVRLDSNGRYVETIDSGLNNCLTVEANTDQAARHFRQDVVSVLFNEGCAAIVPVETVGDPVLTGSYDIKTMRVGKIVEWRPFHVRVDLYDERDGQRKQIWVPKSIVAIVENPLFDVMNEHNSTLRRLIRKLGILDAIDEQSGSGKLDIIIQLPYVVKSEARKQQAEQRRLDIETQLNGSKYGIAYTDGTERITQLNRPAENNLLESVKFLTDMLYAQLGLTPEVMNGTADEATMLNYYSRTIEPIAAAIFEAMRRTFLTKTARSQRQSIMYFRDPFRYVPISQLAEIADKFIRNNVAVPNDIRPIAGWKPLNDPLANKLGNPNMPDSSAAPSGSNQLQPSGLGGNSQNGS